MRRTAGTDTLHAHAQALHQGLRDLVQRYQFRNRNEICCFDVSVSQCFALEELEQHGDLSVGDLAKQMYLDISTMSRVLDQLEKKGYVRRIVNPEDRRAWRVALTSRGKQLGQKMRELAIGKEMEVLKQIPKSSRPAVIFAMKQLVKAVDSWRASSCCIPNKLVKIKH